MELPAETTSRVESIIETAAKIERAAAAFERAEMALRGNSAVQTVVHRSEGPGPLLAAAIAVCFCTILGLILFAIWVVPEVHDLKAWQDTLRQQVAQLKAERGK